MNYLGDFAQDATVYMYLTTNDSSGGTIAPSGDAFTIDDFFVHKNGSAVQKTTSNGMTIVSPFDSVVGVHSLSIDTSNNTGAIDAIKNRKNIIVILMSIELILLAVNINLVAFSIFLGDLTGQVFTLFILTVAAAEAAIGLAIIVVYYRNSGTIRVEEIDKLKG